MHPPSNHRNHTSWSNRSPSTVLDHFAFSQPNVIPSSKSVYPGRSGSQAAPRRSSANAFSQFLFTSIPNNPHSMKFKIPKVPSLSNSNLNHTNLTIKSIPSTLYDDPAFSPDPLSHPFFATSHDAAWVSPPATNIDPNTRSSLSFTPSAPPVNVVNTTNPSMSIPSNTRMLSDHTATTNTTFNDDQPLSTTNVYELPSSSAPSSLDSHQQVLDTAKSAEIPHALSQKKKNTITMFWRKSNNGEKSTKFEPPNNNRHESPPAYDAIFSARPTHSRGISAPEARQSVDRPSMPSRPATTTADTRPPPKRNVAGHPIRAHELDRIDELDESNPLGMRVHHGGPYEAIQKVVLSTTPHNIGNQYQDRLHNPMASRGHQNHHTASVPPPIGVSLNLTPGQVLPHNIQEHYLPRKGFVGGLATHNRSREYLPLQSGKVDRRNHQASQNAATEWSNHHFNLPANVPPAEDPQQWYQPVETTARPSADIAPLRQKHAFPDEQSPSNLASASLDQVGSGPAKTGTQTPDIPNPQQHHFQPQLQQHVLIQHRGLDDNLSHGHIHDTRLDRMTNRRSAGYPQQPSGLKSNLSDVADHSQPIHPDGQGYGDSQHQPEPAGSEQPSRSVDTIHNTSATNTRTMTSNGKSFRPDNQAAPQESRDRDLRSSQQTIASTGGSSNSQNGGRAPKPRHLPKRLVMPTPLQPSQLNAPRGEALYPLHDPYPPNHPIPAQHLYGRPPSPPSIVSPVRIPQSDKKIARAQEIPMSQSRKLKKRSILGIDGIPPPPASRTALSFEPTITPADPPHVTSPNRHKPDKAPKKVLSKRRADL